MRIIIDAMGGDNAPRAMVEGSLLARERLGVDITLVGDEKQIRPLLPAGAAVTVVHAAEVIETGDDPVSSVRTKTDSSMVVGLGLLAGGGGDAFVSAGSTGALVTGATLIVKRIKGIRRVALAPIIPASGRPLILVDGGANVDCTPELLAQFAVMGDAYAKTVLGVERPRVGLLNNGAEAHKGNEAAAAAHRLLSGMPLEFYGNVEARHVLDGVVDVLVADGFAGNILLKSIEGTAIYFSRQLKTMFTKNLVTKLCALALRGGIGELKKKFDYNEHGGAPVLGASKAVIKAHGSSSGAAFYNAIRQAKQFSEGGAINSITNFVKNT